MTTNPSPRPKSVALMFLLGAFLTGGAVGYAATRTFSPSAAAVSVTPAQMRTVIKTNLSLTPVQIAQFDSSYNVRRAAFDSIRAEFQPPIDSIRALYQPTIDSIRVANHERVMQFLDSTQQAKYRQMIEDDKKRADSTRKAGGQK